MGRGKEGGRERQRQRGKKGGERDKGGKGGEGRGENIFLSHLAKVSMLSLKKFCKELGVAAHTSQSQLL